MKFDGPRIVCTATGEDFDEFKGHFTDEERGFGYIRLLLGDEMSKRRKFLFLTWIGPEVGVLKRAKMSCDKAIIKEVINVSLSIIQSPPPKAVFYSLPARPLQSFAVELQAESQSDLDMTIFREALEKAGGANYGTGFREN